MMSDEHVGHTERLALRLFLMSATGRLLSGTKRKLLPPVSNVSLGRLCTVLDYVKF